MDAQDPCCSKSLETEFPVIRSSYSLQNSAPDAVQNDTDTVSQPPNAAVREEENNMTSSDVESNSSTIVGQQNGSTCSRNSFNPVNLSENFKVYPSGLIVEEVEEVPLNTTYPGSSPMDGAYTGIPFENNNFYNETIGLPNETQPNSVQFWNGNGENGNISLAHGTQQTPGPFWDGNGGNGNMELARGTQQTPGPFWDGVNENIPPPTPSGFLYENGNPENGYHQAPKNQNLQELPFNLEQTYEMRYPDEDSFKAREEACRGHEMYVALTECVRALYDELSSLKDCPDIRPEDAYAFRTCHIPLEQMDKAIRAQFSKFISDTNHHGHKNHNPFYCGIKAEEAQDDYGDDMEKHPPTRKTRRLTL